ncbi:MAG: (d)CMP kinase [Ruminococcaceae bacterium]|nr:(d)CMP kinase [Oscillospiraceae bacterium]
MSYAIAIDGPAGAGKSTIARRIAERLKILYLDTGAMYRAIGYAAVTQGISPRDAVAVAKMLEQTELEIAFVDNSQRVILNGNDVTGLIRTPEMSRAASDISALPVVRQYLVERQRELASVQPLVMDGRDIGSYVLPDAPCKFFLTATPNERARRRLSDLRHAGDEVSTLENVLDDIVYRDHQDSTRSMAPLVQAADAILVDTTNLTIEQVVETLLQEINKKSAKNERDGNG